MNDAKEKAKAAQAALEEAQKAADEAEAATFEDAKPPSKAVKLTTGEVLTDAKALAKHRKANLEGAK